NLTFSLTTNTFFNSSFRSFLFNLYSILVYFFLLMQSNNGIFTTGLTTNEISKLLKLSGANKVFVLTLLTKANDNYIME
ncbi:hypothetical protein ACTPEF_27480, partial [Clostridioides difficile]